MQSKRCKKPTIKSPVFLSNLIFLCLILLPGLDTIARSSNVGDDFRLSYLIEQEQGLSIKELNERVGDDGFQSVPGRTLNLGYGEKAVWIRIDLPQRYLQQDDNWVLIIQNYKLNRVSLFFQDRDGDWQHQTDGIEEHRSQNRRLDREITFRVTNPQTDSPIYLRIEAYYYRIPIQFTKSDAYYAEQICSILSDGLFYGLALAITLYHLLIFKAIRNRAYLSYSMFLAAVIVLYLSGQGWLYAFIFRGLPVPFSGFAHLTSPIVGWLLLMLGIQFTRDYLNISEYSKGLNRAFCLLQAVLAILGVIGLVLLISGSVFLFAMLYNVGFIVILATIALCACSVFQGFQHHQITAKYYFVATSLQFFVSILMILSIYQLIPLGFGWKILQASAVIEMLIFSYGLSRHVKKIEDEKQSINSELQKTQEQVIRQLNTINELKDRVLSSIMESRLYPEFAKLFSVMNKISYIQAMGNFSRIVYLDEGLENELEIEASLKEIEKCFDETIFFRIHKSYIVRPSSKLSLQRRSSADYDLISPHFVLPIGRKYISFVKDTLSLNGD